jgi:ribosomal protein S18 acetylase RimI-like enzyme
MLRPAIAAWAHGDLSVAAHIRRGRCRLPVARAFSLVRAAVVRPFARVSARRRSGSAARERALLTVNGSGGPPAGHREQRIERMGGDAGAALHEGHARKPFAVLVGAGSGGDQAGGDLLAVQEDRPEEDCLERERKQEPERGGRRCEGGRDGDDDRDHEAVERLDEDRGRELAEPVAEELMAAAREDPSLDEATVAGKPLSIHVERESRALNLYERLGFRRVGEHGLYLRMESDPGSAEARIARGAGQTADFA